MEPDDAPDIDCDADVLAYIKTVRQEVYLFSRLKTGNLQPCPDDSAPRSRNEWKRGVTERTLMAQLSQFYHRRPQDKFWSRPFLLKEGEHWRDHLPGQRHSAYLCSLQS